MKYEDKVVKNTEDDLNQETLEHKSEESELCIAAAAEPKASPKTVTALNSPGLQRKKGKFSVSERFARQAGQTSETVKKRRSLWLLLCYPVGILCLLLAANNSYLAEELFAKRIFRIFSQTVAAITGVLPFSLAEFCLVVGFPLLLLVLLFQLFRFFKKKNRSAKQVLKGIRSGGKIIVLTGGVLFLWFVLGCGVNYYRYSISYYCDLEVKEASAEELYELCRELAIKANEARNVLGTGCEDEQGVYYYNGSMRELATAAKNAYLKIGEQYPILSGSYPAPKLIALSSQMSKTQITGIFIPFTMEANVNIDISDYSIASTMCHELAHLRGFIREDEANYIAYLVCVNSDNPDLIYSGYMEALILSGNALYEKNQELYYQVRELYEEGVVRDLADNSRYWKQFENTVISVVADKVNDTYLKMNHQEDGVQSYGRMVDLLLAEYRKRKQQ